MNPVPVQPPRCRFQAAARRPFPGWSWLAAAAALLLLALLPAVCGGGATFTFKELKFQPEEITIKAGEAVTWKNDDRRSHLVMSGVPLAMTDEFISPVLEPGESWSHRFDAAGEYSFHDMKVPGSVGRILVQE